MLLGGPASDAESAPGPAEGAGDERETGRGAKERRGEKHAADLVLVRLKGLGEQVGDGRQSRRLQRRSQHGRGHPGHPARGVWAGRWLGGEAPGASFPGCDRDECVSRQGRDDDSILRRRIGPSSTRTRSGGRRREWRRATRRAGVEGALECAPCGQNGSVALTRAAAPGGSRGGERVDYPEAEAVHGRPRAHARRIAGLNPRHREDERRKEDDVAQITMRR